MDLAQAQIANRGARRDTPMCGALSRTWAVRAVRAVAATVAAAIAVTVGLTGCSSGPTTILESDVPLVAGTEVRLSTDIHLRGGELLSGHAICFGAMEDAEAAVKETDCRFADHGWAVLKRTGSRDRVETTYFKGDRRAIVLVEFNSIDPEMSRATIDVSSTAAGANQEAPSTPAPAEPPAARP